MIVRNAEGYAITEQGKKIVSYYIADLEHLTLEIQYVIKLQNNLIIGCIIAYWILSNRGADWFCSAAIM